MTKTVNDTLTIEREPPKPRSFSRRFWEGTRDKKLMNGLANSRLTNYAAYAVAALIIVLNVFLLFQTFLGASG